MNHPSKTAGRSRSGKLSALTLALLVATGSALAGPVQPAPQAPAQQGAQPAAQKVAQPLVLLAHQQLLEGDLASDRFAFSGASAGCVACCTSL